MSATDAHGYIEGGVGPPPLQSDGISFVIQTSGQSPGLSTGGQMGYTGIGNSVAIEFDAYQNIELDDPSFPHIGVHTGGIGTANHAHESSSLLTEQSIGLTGTARTAHITYDPRAKTLQVRIGVNLLLSLENFRLENHMKLDDGQAYIGLMATTGDPGVTNGHTTLLRWNASFPQSCEEVYWEKPFNTFNALGYDGDTFDHRITGNFLQIGDQIKESIKVLTNDVGLQDQDIRGLESANSSWIIEQDVRHGVSGLWRGRYEPAMPDGEFDSHRVNALSDSIDEFIRLGRTKGTITILQTMQHVPTNAIVARHRITLKVVKIDPLFTVGQQSCFSPTTPIHQVGMKRSAREITLGIWDGANLDPPQIPCPP